jgi:hypothetical protein
MNEFSVPMSRVDRHGESSDQALADLLPEESSEFTPYVSAGNKALNDYVVERKMSVADHMMERPSEFRSHVSAGNKALNNYVLKVQSDRHREVKK